MSHKDRVDVCVTIDIEPKGKRPPQTVEITRGGKKHLVRGVKDQMSRNYEMQLAASFAMELPEFDTLEGPVMLHILAVHKRPKTLSKKVRHHMAYLGLSVKSDRLVWRPSKPDIDNIRKSVQDALKAHWGDDSQVVLGTSIKAYGREGDRSYIMIRLTDRLPSPEVAAHMAGLPVLERMNEPVDQVELPMETA